MGLLWDQIRTAIEREMVVIGVHAAVQLRDRHIPAWQTIGASLEGRLICERPSAKPNPAVEVDVLLADGTSAKAVWSWLQDNSRAKLVTIHVYDR